MALFLLFLPIYLFVYFAIFYIFKYNKLKWDWLKLSTNYGFTLAWESFSPLFFYHGKNDGIFYQVLLNRLVISVVVELEPAKVRLLFFSPNVEHGTRYSENKCSSFFGRRLNELSG